MRSIFTQIQKQRRKKLTIKRFIFNRQIHPHTHTHTHLHTHTYKRIKYAIARDLKKKKQRKLFNPFKDRSYIFWKPQTKATLRIN